MQRWRRDGRSALVLLGLAGGAAWLLRSWPVATASRVLAVGPAAGWVPPATVLSAPTSAQGSNDPVEGAAGARRPGPNGWHLTGALLHQEVLEPLAREPPAEAPSTPSHGDALRPPPVSPSMVGQRSDSLPPPAPLRTRPAGAGPRGTDQRLPRNPPEECLTADMPTKAPVAAGSRRAAAGQAEAVKGAAKAGPFRGMASAGGSRRGLGVVGATG
eukprot:scaffold4583_cov107-Isochrysis_galbana.AAC.2